MTTTFASHFVTKTRAEGVGPADGSRQTFVTLTETAPNWLKEAVREAHQGDLPTDWIYAECQAAAQAIDDGAINLASEDDDDIHTHTDGRVDIYTKDLYQWAADFCLTQTWAAAEQEAKDMGMPEETERRVAAIQYAAIRHVADVVRQACVGAVKAGAEG